MYKLFFFLVMISFVSCESEPQPPSTPIGSNNPPGGGGSMMQDPTISGTKLKMGTFQGIGGHNVSGMAALYDIDGVLGIVLTSAFSSTSGPDLKVYLSKDHSASEYVNLGKLKSTSGQQVYTVPAGLPLSQYHYVHIWCQKFTVEFGRAELK